MEPFNLVPDPSVKGGTDDSENALSAALDSPSGDVIVKQVAELLLDETKYEQVRYVLYIVPQ